MRVLPRGNWLDESGEVVTPGRPAVPAAARDTARPARRRGSTWRTGSSRRENPLTARVFVNRLWKLFFGQGLSRTLDDLGAQGEWPTHPELLDWLAVEFVESGWDVKHMVRPLVTSATYRQIVARSRRSCRERDPDNRLSPGRRASASTPRWSATTRWRSAACCRRGSAARASSRTSPPATGRTSTSRRASGTTDQGDDQYRRGLYTYWQRTFLHPSLLAFDAPSREECTAERAALEHAAAGAGAAERPDLRRGGPRLRRAHPARRRAERRVAAALRLRAGARSARPNAAEEPRARGPAAPQPQRVRGAIPRRPAARRDRPAARRRRA